MGRPVSCHEESNPLHKLFTLYIIFYYVFQCEELKKEVKDEHSQWVAQYLVMKRASIEPNFHTLYTNFIDALNNTEITQMVVLETFRNIKVNHMTLTMGKFSLCCQLH